MKRSLLLGLCLTALAAVSAGPAAAMGGPEDQSEDVFSLGEVVVSGRVDAVEAAEVVHVITAEEIKRSSARTLDEALVLLSDVNVHVGNEGVPRVDIRGFKTRHVLLLLDGIPMNSTFDQQFDPSMIPVDNIAKIKVTSGASSVLYGQGGLGGVINIITKKGKKGLTGKAGFESGDGQPYLAKASLSGGKGMFDFFASGSVFQRDRFPLARNFQTSDEEKAGYRKNSDSSKQNAFFNLGFTPNSDLTMALTFNWVEGGYGKPASAIDNKFDPYAPPPKYGRVDWFGGHTIQLAVDYTASRALSVRSMLYYNRMDQDNNQYDNENYNSFDDPSFPNSYKLRNRGINRGLSVQPKYDLGEAGILTFSGSAEWDTWNASGLVKTGTGGSAAGGYGVGGGSPPYLLYPVSDHKDFYIYSVALQYDIAPIENLAVSVGAAQHWQMRDERDLSNYSVTLSSSYDLSRGTRLKGAFQRNIRFPSLSQLYLRDSDNPDLKTERVFHYQLGVEQKLPQQSLWKLDAYRSDLYDVIALQQKSDPTKNINYPAKNVNFSHYLFYGFVTEIESRFMPRLATKASYTFLKSEDLSGVGRNEVQYVPRDKFAASCKYDFDFGFTPFVSVIYVANSFVYSKQKVDTTPGKMKLSDYFLVNLKLSQKLLGDRANVYLGADNLFNVEYEQSYGVPRPGRFIYGGFEYAFGG